MTDKEKNQAVFTAMCNLADKYLNMVKNTETMRKATEKKPMLTYKDLTTSERKWLRPLYERAIIEFFDDDKPVETVIVGNFRCTFMASDILDLMKHFGNANKYTFTLQQEEQRQLIAKFSMDFENGAKRLADITPGKRDNAYYEHQIFRNICIEYDMQTTAVNLVATDMYLLSVITDDDDSIAPNDNNKAVAMLPAEDWKRLCDAMRKDKCAVEFTFYERDIDKGERFATLVANAGDVIVRSIQPDEVRFPNWRIVLPDRNGMRYYEITEKDRKEAQKWLSKLKKCETGEYVSVSVYEGSDRIYFDYCEPVYYARKATEWRRRTVSFELTHPADRTEGTSYKPECAKRFSPVGFWIGEPNRATLVADKDFDVLLAMPTTSECVTFDIEQREMAVAIA